MELTGNYFTSICQKPNICLRVIRGYIGKIFRFITPVLDRSYAKEAACAKVQ
jgi:hypothetical protein